ncbi:DUF1799 domain-containing protein [Aurantiacibacter xanthus]|uniref:DUF1799 domain-containing protein n=1 Tax=Aurantiacibacter xanthus TaxID=1784712 RepID=UPI00174B18BE|nr:DUF1799 domain-containing protein [Aurantiacibacter xanthus]
MLGAPPEAVAAIRARGGERCEFEVWPENWPSLQAFLACTTQWRTIPMAGGQVYYQGLDYASVSVALSGRGITSEPPLWADLQAMEGAARNRLNGVIESD